MGSITWIDWAIWAVYFTVVLLALWVYRTGKKEDHYRYFIGAFIIKVIGGVAFALIYVYYYSFGDTFLYYRGASVLSQVMVDNPQDYFRLLMTTNAALPPDLSEFATSIAYSRGAEEWFTVKLLSPIVLASFQSYLITTFITSVISFFGSWKLYAVFRDIMPNKNGLNFILAFLIPSTLFWGTGIMKDTFTLAGINYIIYGLYFTVYKGQFDWKKFLGIAIASYIVFAMKGYIVLAFIPAFLLGMNQNIKNKIKSAFFRYFIAIGLTSVTTLILYIGPGYLQNTSSKYQLESLEWRVKGFHSWHTDVGGSTYDLGEVEYTTTGVLRKIPEAINVTFFRPYLWEARSPVVLIAAIESIILLVLCILIIYRLRFKTRKLIGGNPMLTTFLIYSLVFGFVVGFTSYNFGALARYKIPVYSLFFFVVMYLYEYSKKERKVTHKVVENKEVEMV